jgi:hypothetical protein
VWVDGKEVTENGIIIGGNDTGILDGFIENRIVKNKFKFVKVSDEIRDFRGEFPEDGLIRIEVIFENRYLYPEYGYKPAIWYIPWKPNEIDYTTRIWTDEYTIFCSSYSPKNNEASVFDFNSISNENGITVKGEEVNQHLSSDYFYNDGLEESSVIVFKLVGYDGEIKTTRDKIQCDVCGRMNKSSQKYCSACGNYLG